MDHIIELKIEQINKILPELDVEQLTKVLKHIKGYVGKKSKDKGLRIISPEKLECIAENNLSYVIQMLNSTATHQSDSIIENYAFIESFLIHARILIEFLNSRPTDEDTIIAKHYVGEWETYKGKDDKESIKYLEDQGKRMNKLLAHLTEEGSMREGEDKRWDRTRICNEINKRIIFFLSAPDNKISDKTKSKIRKLTSTGPRGCAMMWYLKERLG